MSTGLKKTVNTTYGLALNYHFADFLSKAQQRLFAVKNYETGLASFFWFRCSHIPLHSANQTVILAAGLNVTVQIHYIIRARVCREVEGV